MSEPPKAVFISYAREDTAAAQRIAEALRSHGVEVWFDQNELRGGDAWDAKIRKQINDCTLFLPIISQHTQERGKGYFRLEWKLAVEQTHLMAEGIAFLAPVVIDDTTESAAVVPPEFLRVQWTRLAGALPTTQFVEQVKRLLAATVTPGITPAPFSMPPASAAAAKSKLPIAVAALVAVALAVMGWLWHRPSDRPAAPAVASTASLPNDKSIAVLPFENMSADKDNAYFCDGMQEDILTQLGNIRELRVISRTSAEQYRNSHKPIPQIARELGVAWVLEGSVQRVGNKVRVTGQLIRGDPEEHLWAKNYDKDLTAADVFAIQSQLAEAITAALQVSLSPAQKSRLEKPATTNIDAYAMYNRARDDTLRSHNAAEWLAYRETWLNRAIALDPKFTLAWVGIANVHELTYFWNIDHTPRRLEQARAALGVAAKLEPDAPAVICEKGFLDYTCLHDLAGARAAYNRAIALLPNYAQAYARRAYVDRREGDWAAATAGLRKAHALDRGAADYIRELSQGLESARRYDDARIARQELLDVVPDSTEEAFNLARLPFLADGTTRATNDWFDGLPPERNGTLDVRRMRLDWAVMRGDASAILDLCDSNPGVDLHSPLPPAKTMNGRAYVGLWRESYAMALRQSGQATRAQEELKAGQSSALHELERQPENIDLLDRLALLEAMQGDGASARTHLERSADIDPDMAAGNVDINIQPVIDRVLALAWLGEKDGALRGLAHLLSRPNTLNVHILAHHLVWNPLQGNPRFEALLNDPKNNAPLF